MNEDHPDKDHLLTPPGADAPGALAPIDTTDLQKELRDKARETIAAAKELEQAAFFTDYEFEPAFFATKEQLKKQYTGAQAENIEWRRDTCIYLLSMNCPKEDIMKNLKMNARTIEAIAANHAQALAQSTEKMVSRLTSSAMADLAVAETKRAQTGGKDLAIIAGIKLTHATAMKLGGMGNEEPDAIDIQSEDPKLAAARKFLADKKPKPETGNEE